MRVGRSRNIWYCIDVCHRRNACGVRPRTDMLSETQQETISASAEVLYGLIHARYILTAHGMAAMEEKFVHCDFGRCPRALCQGQPVLPVGQSDLVRQDTVKIFCPRCKDIFYPRSSKQGHVDGCFFGTTFPHLFLKMYPEHVPKAAPKQYIPRIYGFKINKLTPEREKRIEAKRARDQELLKLIQKSRASKRKQVAAGSGRRG